MIKGIFPEGFLFFWCIHVHIMYNDQCFRDAMQNPAQNFQQIKKKQKRKHFCKGVICRFSIKKKKPSQKELYHKFALFSSPHLMSPPPQHTVHLSE